MLSFVFVSRALGTLKVLLKSSKGYPSMSSIWPCVRNPILLHLITLSRTNLHFTHTVTLVHAHDHMSYACPGLCTDSVGI